MRNQTKFVQRGFNMTTTYIYNQKIDNYEGRFFIALDETNNIEAVATFDVFTSRDECYPHEIEISFWNGKTRLHLDPELTRTLTNLIEAEIDSHVSDNAYDYHFNDLMYHADCMLDNWKDA